MIKSKLARTFGRQRFESFDDFRVAVKFVEAAVNNRPVWTVKGKRDEYFTISPSQFINPGDSANFDQIVANAIAPLINDSMTVEQAADRIFQQRAFFAKLHEVFQRDYIDALRTWHNAKIFTTKGSRSRTVKIGDIVLLKPDSDMKKNSPWKRTQWSLGKVRDTHSLRDGIVRKVDVDVLGKNGKIKTKKDYTLQHFAPIEYSRGYEEFLKEVTKIAVPPKNV